MQVIISCTVLPSSCLMKSRLPRIRESYHYYMTICTAGFPTTKHPVLYIHVAQGILLKIARRKISIFITVSDTYTCTYVA